MEHVIAAKAVCFKEALQPEFKTYQEQILKNAKALSKGLMDRGVKIVSGGTDNHLMLVDLRGLELTGKELEKLLDEGGIHELASVYGGQKDEDRQRCVDRFQANELFVASVNVAAGGCALSLHDVRHERQRVSYIVPSFNASEIKQALGRIRRVGGTPVVQKFVIAAGTLMERVAVSLNRKMSNLASLNDEDLMEGLEV